MNIFESPSTKIKLPYNLVDRDEFFAFASTIGDEINDLITDLKIDEHDELTLQKILYGKVLNYLVVRCCYPKKKVTKKAIKNTLGPLYTGEGYKIPGKGVDRRVAVVLHHICPTEFDRAELVKIILHESGIEEFNG